MKDWNNYGTHLYPSIVINNVTLRGRLTPDHVMEATCAAFYDEPKQCKKFQEKLDIPMPSYQVSGINAKNLLVIMIVLAIVTFIIILVYRSYLNKELNKGMQVQVQSAVSQYVALSKIPELSTSNEANEEERVD